MTAMRRIKGSNASNDDDSYSFELHNKGKVPTAFDLTSYDPAKTGYLDKKSSSFLTWLLPCCLLYTSPSPRD